MHPELEKLLINDSQANRIQEWLEANQAVGVFLGGYPLGRSYVDPRAASGADIVARKEYVTLDHAVAKEVPQLAGYRAVDIAAFIAERTLKNELSDEKPSGLSI